MDQLSNLCLKAEHILKANAAGKDQTEALRIIQRFIKEQTHYDENTNRMKAKSNKEICRFAPVGLRRRLYFSKQEWQDPKRVRTQPGRNLSQRESNPTDHRLCGGSEYHCRCYFRGRAYS